MNGIHLMRRINNVLWLLPLLWMLDCPAAMGKTLTIQSKIEQGVWSTAPAIYPLRGQTISLRIPKVAGASVRWYQIRPRLDHMYKNANHPWEPNPYKWVGLGRIEFERRAIPQLDGQWEVKPFTTSTVLEPGPYYHPDIGSFWFQVEVKHNGDVLRSTGLESNPRTGISEKVFRVSIRDGKDYLGYVTSYFNVPAVFGSITRQSNDYQGVDCADLLVAAHRRWHGTLMKKNFNVSMLVNLFPRIAEFNLTDGAPDKTVNWKKLVRRGDLIAVRYPGARQFQHIGALSKDANGNGLLDGADLVLHAGPWPLQSSRLDEGGFDGYVVILRPR